MTKNKDDKPTLKSMLFTKSEIQRVADDLGKVKNSLDMGDTEAAKKRLEDLIEYVGDDINYMETFGQRFPVEKVRELVKYCIEEKRVPFMNDAGIHTSDYNEMISQPTEGVLYDLNRDYASLYSMYSNRTINDLGCAVLITLLLEENKKLKKKK